MGTAYTVAVIKVSYNVCEKSASNAPLRTIIFLIQEWHL